MNPKIKAISWKRPVADAVAVDANTKKAEARPLPAGWEKKFDKSKGKYFYMNRTMKAISWKRPVDGDAEAPTQSAAKRVKGAATAHTGDSRAAADVVHNPHFRNPAARNPTYEGTGNELNEALAYNKAEVAAAKGYYAKVAAQREQRQKKKMAMQHEQGKKSPLTELGSRSFFKFDPIKGSFYRYSPDVGVTAKPGSIADTLNKVAASAKTPTISINTNHGPALPNGDIIASARKPAASAHPAKLHLSSKKAVDLEHSPEYKAAAAKANSELMNVARAVAINAGYQPGASQKSASAKAKAAGDKAKAETAKVESKSKEGAAAKHAGKGKGNKAAAAQSQVPDPDWAARKAMSQVWKGQRSFYKVRLRRGGGARACGCCIGAGHARKCAQCRLQEVVSHAAVRACILTCCCGAWRGTAVWRPRGHSHKHMQQCISGRAVLAGDVRV